MLLEKRHLVGMGAYLIFEEFYYFGSMEPNVKVACIVRIWGNVRDTCLSRGGKVVNGIIMIIISYSVL